MTLLPKFNIRPDVAARYGVDNVADGYEAIVSAALAAKANPGGPVLFVLRDGQRIAMVEAGLRFAAPNIPVLVLPSWDCLPYDRVSPGSDTAARRLAAMSALIALQKDVALLSFIGPVELLRQAGVYKSLLANFTPYLGAALIFLAVTVPATRWVDRLIARQNAARS